MVKLFFLSDLPRKVVHCTEINDSCVCVCVCVCVRGRTVSIAFACLCLYIEQATSQLTG